MASPSLIWCGAFGVFPNSLYARMPMSQDRFSLLGSDFPAVSTDAWHRKIEEDLQGAPFEVRLVWTPPEGFPVQPFYRAEDLDAIPEEQRRAARPARAATNSWHIRQDIASADVAHANRRAREALGRGATALGFIFPPEPRNSPGIRLAAPADRARLLDGIPLAETPIHIDHPAAARSWLTTLTEVAARQGAPAAALAGALVIDPLAWLARQGHLAFSKAVDEMHGLFLDVDASGTALHTLCADARPFHEAGASAVQELAFGVAAASEYLALLTDRGIAVTQIARRLRFILPVGTRFFMEIAKLRALRVLYAQLIRAYTADMEAPPPYTEARTSRWSLTRYDPHANILRATTQAVAAVLGGCDELTIHPHDAAAGPASDFALRIARNVQLLLKHEASLDAVIDPGAGAYYLETLTDQLARHAWALFQQIEARGGLLEALRQGFVQREIQAVREERTHAVATGRQVLVGTNAYPNPEETLPDAAPPPAPPDAPPAVAISEETITIAPLPTHRAAEAFEAVRRAAEAHHHRTGHRPTAFLLSFGPSAAAKARAAFSRNVLGCAGFAVRDNPVPGALEEGIQAALESRADLVILCSANEAYLPAAPTVNAHLKDGGCNALIVVAGDPAELPTALQEAGVDAFIHRNQNLLEALTQLQQRLGISPQA